MPILSTSKAQVYYEVCGDCGPWVCLVNGYSRTSRDFKFIAKKLSQEGFQVLTFDNRGAGLTQTSTRFELCDIAKDLKELMVHLKIQMTHLVGLSMGGMIALEFVRQCTDQIESLVLVSTSLRGRFRPTVWNGQEAEVEERLKNYFARDFLGKNALLFKSMVKQIAKESESQRNRLEEQSSAIANFFADVEGLALLRVPTLVVHGEEDLIIPLDEARAIQVAIPSSQLEVFAACGHLLLAEAPGKLLESIQRFLREVVK